jgi:hypothetical protein
MDPKRPKIQSSRIQMKPMPLCSARHVDSTVYSFLKMDFVWRRYRVLKFFPNRQKVKVNSQQSVLLTSTVRQHDMWKVWI